MNSEQPFDVDSTRASGVCASTTPAPATTKKLHILQHAIGRDEYGRPRSAANPEFRNHFVTGPGSTDYDLCCEATAEGLMTRTPGNAITGGDDVFRVTDAGRAWVRENSPEPPKLTRSQRRYEEFLGADSGLSFGEWLKTDCARSA
jgi:hypothetical protein